MISQNIDLGDGNILEIKITKKDTGVTVSQQLITNGVRALTKTCTVTCYGSGSAKSYSWTCPDNQSCEGDCSDPAHPKGRCY